MMEASSVKFPVDLSLFSIAAHNPSLFMLEQSMRNPGLRLRDFCVPINPYFPPPGLFDELRLRLERVLKFYPSTNEHIADVLCQMVDLNPATVVLANGSTELITWVDRLFIAESLLTSIPTFGRWTDQPRETGKRTELFLRRPQDCFKIDPEELISRVRDSGVRALALSNPNNPTGALMSLPEVLRVLESLRDLDAIVIDESFIDFAREDEVPTVAPFASDFPNLIVIKSLGKNFGLHGIRLGYGVCNEKRAAVLRRALPPWNINAIAEMVIRLVVDKADLYEASRRQVVRDRAYMERELRGIANLVVYPSYGNFLYVKIPESVAGHTVRNELLTRHGVFLRECGNKVGSSSQYFRIAVRPPEEVQILVGALQDVLARPQL